MLVEKLCARFAIATLVSLCAYPANQAAAQTKYSNYVMAVLAKAAYSIADDKKVLAYQCWPGKSADTRACKSLEKKWRKVTPGAFTTLAAVKKLNGFSAAIFRHKKDRSVIVSIAGTRPTDGGDIIADIGIARFNPHNNPVLVTQITEALRFVEQASRLEKRSKIQVVGHSLGGFLAQYVTAKMNVARGVSFNGPGALTGLSLPPRAPSLLNVVLSKYPKVYSAKRRMVNLVRKGDPIGNYGAHYGRRHTFQGGSHSIAKFAKDLKRGQKSFETILASKPLWRNRHLVGLAKKCLNAPWPVTKGKNLRLRKCKKKSPGQRWTMRRNGTIQLGAKAPNRCLDVQGGKAKNGARIHLWPCHGKASQIWRFKKGRLVGIGGKCLDVKGGRNKINAKLILWSCHGKKNQKWASRK